MTTDTPRITAPLPVAAGTRNDVLPPNFGSWRYPYSRTARRWWLLGAGTLSAALHAGLILGFQSHTPPKKHAIVDDPPTIALVMPDLKDLEEPEPTPTDEKIEAADAATLVPRLADAPQIPTADAFVQEIDFGSLIEHPDLSNAKIDVIPEHIRHGTKIGEGVAVFNLADLDRAPEALVQTPPIFPASLKRDYATGTVKVQFIVDTQGRVVNPVVVETSLTGFNEAALNGVAKWKFRPGMKGGKRVNTRMMVPIIFQVVQDS